MIKVTFPDGSQREYPAGTLVTSAHAYNKMCWQRVSMDRYGI